MTLPYERKREIEWAGEMLREVRIAAKDMENWGGPVLNGLVPFSEDNCQIALWSPLRFDRRYSTPVCNVRALFHGHLTLSVAQRIANVYFIDTGEWMVGRGHFTFVDLNLSS